MNKIVRDGRVAVLISPEYGAGWSTWNPKHPGILFDPVIVDFVEKQQDEELQVYVTLKYPGINDDGIVGLTVEWIPQGALFRVNEHDGAETIEFLDRIKWIQA